MARKTRSDDFDALRKHAEEAKSKGPEAVDDIFPQLESLLEDTGRKHELVNSVKDYIDQRTNEIKSIRAIRRVIVGFSILVMIFAFYLLHRVLFRKLPIFFDPNGYAKTAFIAGVFLAVFGTLVILLRGIFAPREREESAGFLPEHVKVLVSLAKEVFKRD